MSTRIRRCKHCKEEYVRKTLTQKYCSQYCAQLGTRRFVVTADELEKLVWEMPTIHVAKKFGVSDKAIEKRCTALGVVKPPRGYWAIVAAAGEMME